MTEQEAQDYINSVNWCFAKTYLSAPHEYTVLSWKPETKDKMIAFAQYIRDNGKVTYFYKKPFIKVRIGDYEYWTMDARVEDTDLINRTFADKERWEAVKAYTTSPRYIHEHRESLLDVEKRSQDDKVYC